MKSVEDLSNELDSLKAALLSRELTESELAELDATIGRLLERLNPAREERSILELKGLGKEFWRSIDVELYLRRERESWD